MGGTSTIIDSLLICTIRNDLSNHNTPPVTTADNVAIALLLALAVGCNSTITIKPFKIIGLNVIITSSN